MVLGLFYILYPIYNILWDVFGVILMITLFSNLCSMFLIGLKLNKNNKLGKKLNLLSYIFIFFNTACMILMALGNILISITYSNTNLANFFNYFLVFLGYFGIIAFGAVFSIINIKNLNNEELWDLTSKGSDEPIKRARLIKNLKILIGAGCFILLGFGCYCGGLILFGSVSSLIGDRIGSSLGSIITQLAIFFAFAMFGSALVLLKLIDRKKRRKLFYVTGILGMIVTGIFLVPVMLTPASIIDSEASFSSAFGINSWDIINPKFMITPFSLPGYFLGIPPKDCTIIENCEYYYNSTENIRLFFDAYLPPSGEDLPGKNSTIIKIHGGAWKDGDKGLGNMMQVNKYLASQGYVVFDIQYGLIATPEPHGLPTPEYVVGNITIDDQLRHIGNFSQYLGLYNDTYYANLDSTFFMGASAGGHLACASGLGIWSGNYTEIFGNNLTIKGIIPLYPGIGYIDDYGFECSPEFAYPEGFINSSSPPALLFQGTQDGLGHPSTSQNFKNTYTEKGNSKCAIVWAHCLGHGADFYFSGHGNQIFLYYLERFLYLCVNGII